MKDKLDKGLLCVTYQYVLVYYIKQVNIYNSPYNIYDSSNLPTATLELYIRICWNNIYI